MGQNSTDVAYGFGQMGSAYTDKAQTIIPPEGMVICAIQYLVDSTPTVLTPEKLDVAGPGFPEITTGTNVTGINSTNTRNSNGYLMAALDDDTTGSSTQTLSAATCDSVRVGSYVLLVNADYKEDGAPAMSIDSETPTPIYTGPNQQGVYVTGCPAGGDLVTLSASITPSSQALIFLDHMHGAGAIIANGQTYPKGLVMYGRWVEFKGEADKGVICYFGY